jgi:hypothetical protein
MWVILGPLPSLRSPGMTASFYDNHWAIFYARSSSSFFTSHRPKNFFHIETKYRRRIAQIFSIPARAKKSPRIARQKNHPHRDKLSD